MQDKIQLFTFLNSSFLNVDINRIFQDKKEVESCTSLCEEAEQFISIDGKLAETNQVESIFSHLAGCTPAYYLPNADLTIKADNFPNQLNTNRLALQQAVNGVLNLPNQTDLAEKLYYIFKQKAWCLKADIDPVYLNEFEYLKSKTAFAVCLHYAQEDNYPFLLFCADISGIQDFIYDIHSKKASKSLKGRSFYLQLLIDSLLERYLKATQTTICNVIYSSGGKFFMLLPNTKWVVDAIENLEKEITTELYELHKDTLSIVTGFVPFRIESHYAIVSETKGIDGMTIHNLKDLWKITSQVTALKKQTKLKSFFKSNFKLFFDGGLDVEFGDDKYEPCAVTGRPTQRLFQNQINPEERQADRKKYVTPNVMQQIQLGEDLRDAQFLNIVETQNGFQPLINSNTAYYELSKHQNGLKKFVINPTCYTQGQPFFFYGGNQQALNPNRSIKTFEELTMPDVDLSFNKLGILRMDVDNLGHLFTGTHNKIQNTTFAAYSTLSAALDWFFSGYLNTVRNESYKDSVNIIYAGGDDLFAVGRWDQLIDFAIDIRKKFRSYIGDNDSITVSGGIAIVNNKFPIAKAAKTAGEALDDAKNHKRHQNNAEPDKDAFHVLGLSVSWAAGANDEMSFVKKLVALFNEYDMNRAFFYKLYHYKILKNEGKMDWYWLSAYHTSRYLQRLRSNQIQEKALLKAIQKAILCTEFQFGDYRFSSRGHDVGRMLDLICLASQLADYYKR
jgi:CRISPR-associated protein Csm1